MTHAVLGRHAAADPALAGLERFLHAIIHARTGRAAASRVNLQLQLPSRG